MNSHSVLYLFDKKNSKAYISISKNVFWNHTHLYRMQVPWSRYRSLFFIPLRWKSHSL